MNNWVAGLVGIGSLLAAETTVLAETEPKHAKAEAAEEAPHFELALGHWTVPLPLFTTSFLMASRRILLISVAKCSGVGARLGVNIGYLKFTPKATWNPF